jgi:hypothetical protein
VFWCDAAPHYAVGVGNTPDEALAALEKKVEELKARFAQE